MADARQRPRAGAKLIKLGAAATVAASLGVGRSARRHQEPALGRPTFFTPAEFALVDELSEMIIPTDAHSPGAQGRQGRGVHRLSARGSLGRKRQDRLARRTDSWSTELSQEASGAAVHAVVRRDQRLAVLTRMAQNEGDREEPEELFFNELKSRVVYAYYTSEIGIKQEMEYKGNTYLTEFANPADEVFGRHRAPSHVFRLGESYMRRAPNGAQERGRAGLTSSTLTFSGGLALTYYGALWSDAGGHNPHKKSPPWGAG